jgi:hypothetical protein
MSSHLAVNKQRVQTPHREITMNAKQRVDNALKNHFPENSKRRDHLGELLVAYAESGLSPPHLLTELETVLEGKLWSCVWEALLHRHLCSLGYEPRNLSSASGQNGPDFCVEHEGRKIWIEAIVPSPEGIPKEDLDAPSSGEIVLRMKRDKERVLRCTSAICDKQKKFSEYLTKGIVGANDCTIIAVNICRLSYWDPDGLGISQLPLVTEAVFPIGPLGFQINSAGKLDGPPQHQTRDVLNKPNGSEIKTDNFLDIQFANISAVMQGHRKDMIRDGLILSTVHNPLARNPMQTGLFGIDGEFVAEERGDEMHIKNIAQ